MKRSRRKRRIKSRWSREGSDKRKEDKEEEDSRKKKSSKVMSRRSREGAEA